MEARWDVPENMTDFKKKTGQKLVSVDQEFLPPWNNNGTPKRLLTTGSFRNTKKHP